MRNLDKMEDCDRAVEIGINDAMIEAGMGAYWQNNRKGDSRSILVDIFGSMFSATNLELNQTKK